MKEQYTVYDMINAGCTLEPIVCLFCKSQEVMFDQYVGDALCTNCGEWQLESQEE